MSVHTVKCKRIEKRIQTGAACFNMTNKIAQNENEKKYTKKKKKRTERKKE